MGYLNREYMIMSIRKHTPSSDIEVLNMRNLKTIQTLEAIEYKNKVKEAKSKWNKDRDKSIFNKWKIPYINKLQNIFKFTLYPTLILTILSILFYILVIL